MDFVVFHLGSSSDYCVWIRQVVEGALFTEHLASVHVSQYKVFLLSLVTYDRFNENVSKVLYWINYFANTSQNKKYVICLLVNFLELETLAHAFLLKINLEIFNESPGQAPELRDVPYKEFHFLFACRQLCFRDYIYVNLTVKFYNFASTVGCNSSIVTSSLLWITLKPKVSVNINCLGVFVLV